MICKYTEPNPTFCCNRQIGKIIWRTWPSIHSWKKLTSTWGTHDFYYGRTTSRCCGLNSRAQTKNGIITNFLIWNRFELVFEISSKLQNWLVCICICFKKNNFFHRKLQFTYKLILRFLKKKLKAYGILLWKFKKWLERAGLMNLLHQLTSDVMNFSRRDYQKIGRYCS